MDLSFFSTNKENIRIISHIVDRTGIPGLYNNSLQGEHSSKKYTRNVKHKIVQLKQVHSLQVMARRDILECFAC